MELSQLRSFVTVADEMHVGRAAARLHLAQPTLSRQLAALERSVGTSLFSRARRRLELTAAGEIFLPAARDILRRTDDAARDARRAGRGELGRLRLGYVQSATYSAIPRLVGQFRAACPDVEVEARAMTTLQQIEALRAGDLDAGLLRPQQPVTGRHGLRTRVISHDRMVVALPAGHRLAEPAELADLRLSALAEEPFVLYPKETGSTGYDLILEACRRAGFEPRIVQEVEGAQAVLAFVAAGVGVSLLIEPTPPIDPSLVVCRPLGDDLPVWELALAWSAGNPSPTLERFLVVTGT